jgi:hypothetical protein
MCLLLWIESPLSLQDAIECIQASSYQLICTRYTVVNETSEQQFQCNPRFHVGAGRHPEFGQGRGEEAHREFMGAGLSGGAPPIDSRLTGRTPSGYERLKTGSLFALTQTRAVGCRTFSAGTRERRTSSTHFRSKRTQHRRIERGFLSQEIVEASTSINPAMEPFRAIALSVYGTNPTTAGSPSTVPGPARKLAMIRPVGESIKIAASPSRMT